MERMNKGEGIWSDWSGVSTLEKCGADGTTTPEVEASENCGAPTSEIKVLETCGAATPDCGEGSGGTTTGDCGEKRTSGDPEKETVVTLRKTGKDQEYLGILRWNLSLWMKAS